MHGLVSLLPQPYHQQVENIWKILETQFNLIGFLVSPIPHFSWQIAEQYDQELLAETVTKISQTIPPLQIRTGGIGLFTGIRQVIYIPIIKDCHLINVHEQIWQAVEPHAKALSPLYGPDMWVPHITLVHENLTPENIGPIMTFLASETYQWEFRIDQLVLISDSAAEDSKLQIKARYPLLG